MIVVTHEMGFARDVADRVVVMDAGEIVELADAGEIFGAPQFAANRRVPAPRSALTIQPGSTTGEAND